MADTMDVMAQVLNCHSNKIVQIEQAVAYSEKIKQKPEDLSLDKGDTKSFDIGLGVDVKFRDQIPKGSPDDP